MGPKIPKHNIVQGHVAKPAAKKSDAHKPASHAAQKPNLFGVNGATVKKTATMVDGQEFTDVWSCNKKGVCTEVLKDGKPVKDPKKLPISKLTQGTIVPDQNGAHYTGVAPAGHTANSNPDPGEATLAGAYTTRIGGFGLTFDRKPHGALTDTSRVDYQITKIDKKPHN